MNKTAKIPDDHLGRTFEERVIQAFGGVSLAKIAEQTGLKYHTLRNYLQQRTDIPSDVLIHLAKTANISIDWLLTGEESKTDIVPFPDNERVESLFTEAERAVIETVAESVGDSYEEIIRKLVMQKLRELGAWREPVELIIPVYKAISDEAFNRLGEVIESAPQEQRRALMTQLIGELVVRAAEQK